MPKPENRWFWLTPREAFADMPGWHVLDILRYDRAVVENNAPEGYVLFSSTVTNGPTVARLRSYGVEPVWVSTRAVEPNAGREFARQFIEDMQKDSARRRSLSPQK